MLNERNGNVRGSMASMPRLKPVASREVSRLLKENTAPQKEKGEEEVKKPLALIPAETKKIRKYFLDEIIRHELGKTPQAFRQEFLKPHKISSEIRARMVS